MGQGKVGWVLPVSKACRLGQAQQADGPVPTHGVQQKIQQICDPDMTRLSFARVVSMEQTYCCAPFPYSSCVSPASALGCAGTSASDRQPQELERIWGDTDHQGNEATTGDMRVETRAASGTVLSFASQRDPSVCLRSSTAGAPAAPWSLSQFCLALPLLNLTAVPPLCSSPSIVTCCCLLIPAHHPLNYCPFFCCSHSPHNLDTCLFFPPWFCSIFLTQRAMFLFRSYHINLLAVVF